MATDTKVKKEFDPNALAQKVVDEKFKEITANLNPEKKEQQNQNREYLTHQLAEKAGARIRKFALSIKASPELRKEIEELAQDIEESVPRLSSKAKTEDALITQIESAVDKAERYIQSVAKEEEKKEKKEEEKRKEKEHKLHPHEPQKPESADKTEAEKNKADLERLKKELHDESDSSTTEVVTTAAIAGVAAGTFLTTNDTKEENTPEEQSSKNRNLSLEERATIQKKELREKGKTNIAAHGETNTPSPTTPQRKMSSPDKERSSPPKSLETILPSQGSKYPKPQVRFPTLHVSSKPLAGKVIVPEITHITNTVTLPEEEEDVEEEYEEYGQPSEQNDRGKNIKGNFRDSGSSQDSHQTQAGGGAGKGDGGGGNYSGGGGGNNSTKRGGLTVPTPHIPNPITRGGLGVPKIGQLTKGGTKGLAKEGVKLALKHPYVRAAIAIAVLVLILIVLLIILIVSAGSGAGTATGTCQAAPAAAGGTMPQPQVSGPTTATAGQTVPYQITVNDTQPSEEITLVATIPQGMSTNQADITSSWTRFTVTGNTITWKATENLPPNSLNTPNFNFTVSLKAIAEVPDAKLPVNATPTRNAVPAAPAQNPGTPGGNVPSAKEKSTEELKALYGASPEDVERQLVEIDFQGKRVKVHGKMQAIFEKVNAEITAANTGYAFRLVGTYAWREKNCPSGCSGLSTHSFGTTIDINWDTNPYTTANTHDIPPAVVEIFKNNGFEWGGDWSGSKDWMHFQYNGEPGAAGGNCTPNGAPITADYTPPSADACGGKYTANMSKNPTGENFGDPTCNFDKDGLHNLLRTEDPTNADFWFNEVVRCESGYNPNAYAGHAEIGTPDPGGAWGLYQMGSSTPPGSPPPAEGRGGANDRGDVPWVLQTKNAVSKGKQLGGTRAGLARYWACAR